MTSPNPRDKMPPRVSDLHTHAKQRRRKVIVLVSFFSAFIVFVGCWWFLVYSNLLRLRQIEIRGNTRLTDDEVVRLLEEKVIGSSLWRRMLGSDHLLAWPRSIDRQTIDTLGNVRGLWFARDYWRRDLTITVEERQFYGILCAQRRDVPQCVWFDKEGFFFEEAFYPDGFLVFRLDDYSRSGVRLGEYLYPDSRLQNTLSIFRLTSGLKLPIAQWSIKEDATDTLNAHVTNGPVIYFNLKSSPDYQAQVIQSLVGEKGIGSLEYIDLRLSGRVYYRDRSRQ